MTASTWHIRIWVICL